MLKKKSFSLRFFLLILASSFLQSCTKYSNITITATNDKALESFQTKSWLTPKMNNANKSLFVTLDKTKKKFTINLNSTGSTVISIELSDNSIDTDTFFNYIVSPGTNQGANSYGLLAWCNDTESNTPIHYQFIDMSATDSASILKGSAQTLTNTQGTFETTGIALGCSKDLIVASWNGNFSTSTFGSRYATADLTKPTLSFSTAEDCFGYPTGKKPLIPIVSVSSSGQFAITQGSSDGNNNPTYGKINAGIYNKRLFLSGSLGDAWTPITGSAPVSLVYESEGNFYVLISDHLGTEDSQSAQKKIFQTDSDGYIQVPASSDLSTTKVYKIFLAMGSDFKSTLLIDSTQEQVVVMMSEIANSTVAGNSGLYYLFTNQNFTNELRNSHILGKFSNDALSYVTPSSLPGLSSNVSIDAFAQNKNWITYLTSSSPTQAVAYNIETNQITLNEQIADFAAENAQISVSLDGTLVIFFTDDQGQVYTKTVQAGEAATVQGAFNKFSPIKYQN